MENKRSVAIKLNCSIHTINRLIHKYKSNGKEGFTHGNRKPSTFSSYILLIQSPKSISLFFRKAMQTEQLA